MPPTPRSTLVGALAIIVVTLWACGSDDPSAAERTPLDVMELFAQGVVEADWSGMRDLYTPEATWQVVTPDDSSPVIRLADELPGNAGVDEWDGDGVLTENDFFSFLGAEVYAGGITDILSCEQPDVTTAVCDEAREGYAFENAGHSASWTVTVSDGQIASMVIDLTGDGIDIGKVAQFKAWAEENRAEQADGLFDAFGDRKITPDTVDTHRRLAMEWLASQ